MYIIKVAMKNFMCYQEETLDLSGINYACFIGKNGHGKSAILDAVTWCIWGYSRNGRSADALVRMGANKMEVALTISIDGRIYTITRAREKNKSSDLYFRSDEDLTEATIRKTQGLIDEVVKMDYVTFISSSFILQGRADEFTKRSPAERKKVLREILSIGDYERLEDKCKDQIKTIKADLRILEQELSHLTLSDSQDILEQTIKARDAIADEIDILSKELQVAIEKKSKFESSLKQNLEIRKAREKLEEIEQDLADRTEIESGFSELQEREERREQLDRKLSELRNKRSEIILKASEKRGRIDSRISASMERKESIINELSRAQVALEDGVCWVCESDAEETILWRKAEDLRIELEQVKKEIEILIESKNELPSPKKIEQEIGVIEEEIESLDIVSYAFFRKKIQFIEIAESQKEIYQEIASMEYVDIQESEDPNEIEKAIEYRREEYNRLSEEVGRLRSLVAKEKEDRSREIEIKEDQKTLERNLILTEKLKEAFGKNGIVALIIDHAIPQIEDTANSLLGKMTEGRLSVIMDTQKELKNGKTAETLDILVSDQHGSRDYETLSGGEKFRVNLAIRIALSKLIAENSGMNLQTLIIDEGFGSQDKEGIHKIIKAIDAISDEFDLVLIITHIDGVQEMFDTIFYVEKTFSGSTITQKSSLDKYQDIDS